MTQPGLDALALGSHLFPVEGIIKIVPTTWAIGAFFDLFGDCRQDLGALYNHGFRTFRIHMHWDDGHKIVPLDVLIRKAPLMEKFKKNHPEATVYLSHSCEYNEASTIEIKKRIETIKRLAPSCIPVSTPMHSAAIPGTTIERHGDTTVNPGQIVSMDGADYRDLDWFAWLGRNKNAAIQFFWFVECNGTQYGGPKLPREKRTHFPTWQDLRKVVDIYNSYQ